MFFYAPSTLATNFFVEHLKANNLLCNDPKEASFLVLPFMYEIIYDYNHFELSKKDISQNDVSFLKEVAMQLDALSLTLEKKLIVFFYRDPIVEIPFKNAIIFRTSALASNVNRFTFGLPAFIDDRYQMEPFLVREKPNKPTIGFRGRASPLSLNRSVWLRYQLNKLFDFLNLSIRVKSFQPQGYLLRRAALKSCLNHKYDFNLDFLINPSENMDNYKENYVSSLQNADYIINAAGFGNYAYRLYETMRFGRIPVFIDSDILLPCADEIPWKNIMIWVPAKDAANTAKYITAFHEKVTPCTFAKLQEDNQYFYYKYLTQEGFSKYLLKFLNQHA